MEEALELSSDRILNEWFYRTLTHTAHISVVSGMHIYTHWLSMNVFPTSWSAVACVVGTTSTFRVA